MPQHPPAMTAATVQLCGHRWRGRCRLYTLSGHRCDRPVDLGHPGPCRCRCGATTERPSR